MVKRVYFIKFKCGGQVKFYLYKKVGAERVLAMLKVGGHKTFDVVLTWEHEFVAILMGGGRKKFPPFKMGGGGGGAKKVLPCLDGGGGATSFGSAIFVGPPLIINDRSLKGGEARYSQQ